MTSGSPECKTASLESEGCQTALPRGSFSNFTCQQQQEVESKLANSVMTVSVGQVIHFSPTSLCAIAEGEKYQQLRDGKLLLLPSFTRSFQDMLKSLMHTDPARRPSGAAVQASPLITKRVSQDGFAPLSLQRSIFG